MPKTTKRPLSQHALKELLEISKNPKPAASMNPGTVNRLTHTEKLARIVQLPSPFKIHRGGTCPHLEITEKGLKRLNGQA